MVNRVLRDDPTKSSMHNREGLTVMKIWKILKDWRMWPIYVLGIIFMGTFLCRGYAARTHLHAPVPVTTPQTYLTLSLRNLGFSTTQSNLLSIPSKVLGMLLLLVFCYLSEVVNSRISVLVLLQLWALPLLIALYTFTTNTSPWAYYAVVTLIVGFPYVHPIQVAWASTNSAGVGTRTVSASIYNMFVQAGGIVAVSTFAADALHVTADSRHRTISLTSTRMTTKYV